LKFQNHLQKRKPKLESKQKSQTSASNLPGLASLDVAPCFCNKQNTTK